MIPIFSFHRRHIFLSLALLVCCCQPVKKAEYAPAGCPLPTQWTTLVNPENAWQEYPRPQMVREHWMNLNGLWDYVITAADAARPDTFRGKILVPFPPESCLSGVGKILRPGEKIWYHTTFRKDRAWKDDRIILNVEAADWETTVWVNGNKAGTHKGGYDPFSFEITDFLKDRGEQELLISVWDPTDTGYQPRGKQVLEPGGIWYTPVSGIWQTIWLEPLNPVHITDLRIIPDPDNSRFLLNTAVSEFFHSDSVQVILLEKGTIKGKNGGKPGEDLPLDINEPHAWSPSDPFLYDLEIKLYHEGMVTDSIRSYAGLRKISIGKDQTGITRLMFNNEYLFQNGPLDQGFWPDGIYTPATEAAMKYDLEVMKEIGFNMLRKHVKVENRRFYHWCDRMGILVWQDMPSGFRSDDTTAMTAEEKVQFESELTALVNTHFNSPSIVMWVPFNEGWGQYDTPRIVELIRGLDPTRLVNNASGWSDAGAGDVIDWHHYPEPVAPVPEESRAAVLGEFGGLGYYVEGHTWQEANWGYKKMSSLEELSERYSEYYDQIWKFSSNPGISACIYTQITDVETETNGLMTYDREVIKMDRKLLRSNHLSQSFQKIRP